MIEFDDRPWPRRAPRLHALHAMLFDRLPIANPIVNENLQFILTCLHVYSKYMIYIVAFETSKRSV